MSSESDTRDIGFTNAVPSTMDGQVVTTNEQGDHIEELVLNSNNIAGSVFNGPVSITVNNFPIQYAKSRDKKMFLVPIKPTNRLVRREDILETMRAAIRGNRSKDVTVPVVLKGIGGMGKSELMLNYCYQHREDYLYVFWLHVNGSKATRDAFQGLAKKLGIFDDINKLNHGEELIYLIRKWLESRTGWLLLLDNMDSVYDVDPYIPSSGGDVIVTTRNHVLSSWATVIEVDKMTNEEALHLLLGFRSASEDAKSIVQELDCFPLAINIARSYIESTNTSFHAYLKSIKQNPMLLLSRSNDIPSRYEETVATVWNLSFEKIKERNPLAIRILDACAFLKPEAIPTSLFQKQYSALKLFLEEDNPLGPVEDVISAIGVLVEFSFVRRKTVDNMDETDPTTDMLTINRMIQTVIRKSIQSTESLRWLERIIIALNGEVVSDAYYTPRFHTANEVHLPHVRHIVAQLENPTQMAADSQVHLINLLRQTSMYLIGSGVYQGTEELAQMAVPVSEANHGTEHFETATSLYYLAYLFDRQGKYDKAEPLYERALAIREKVFGSEHPDTATSLQSLAYLYKYKGMYDKARPLYERTLAIREKVLGSEHPDTATSLNDLATHFQREGKYDFAQPLYEQVLAIREKVLGSDHPETAATLNNLAGLYENQGKYDYAELLYRRALAIRKKVLGPEHPKTVATLNDLAELYNSQGTDSLYRRKQLNSGGTSIKDAQPVDGQETPSDMAAYPDSYLMEVLAEEPRHRHVPQQPGTPWTLRQIQDILRNSDNNAISKLKSKFPSDEEKLYECLSMLQIVELAACMVWIPFHKITQMERLGEGGFSIVYKASVNDIQKRRRFVALKILKENSLATDQLRNELLANIYLRLCNNSSLVATPAVIGLSRDGETGCYILVLEYAARGNLAQLLIKSPPNSWLDVLQIATELARRLQVIHRAGLIHNDLHPGNIVFIGNAKPMIIDVGISNTVEYFSNQGDHIYGRIDYLPPEAFKKTVPYTQKSDIYCLGTLLWQLTARYCPRGLAVNPPEAAASAHLREEPIPGTPKEYSDIFKRCWNLNPEERPTIDKVLADLESIEMEIANDEWLDDIPEALAHLEKIKGEIAAGESGFQFIEGSRSHYHQKAELENLATSV